MCSAYLCTHHEKTHTQAECLAHAAELGDNSLMVSILRALGDDASALYRHVAAKMTNFSDGSRFGAVLAELIAKGLTVPEKPAVKTVKAKQVSPTNIEGF